MSDTVMAVDKSTIQQYERAFGPVVHMSFAEKAIWTSWLQLGGTQFAPFTYDVRVGDGLIMPDGSSSYAIKAAYALTTKRIDVVYFDQGIPIIVEVKVRAGGGAIGQLIMYRDLWQRSNTASPPPRMLLVTDALQPDLAGVLDQQGIIFNIV